ncbi:MAG: hypothetical protein ACK2TU_00660 [Anaerolineales bacterium]|jgi:lysine biosynthesis protein LysW
MIIAECPNCNAHIEIETVPVIGMPVVCYRCCVNLEVIWLYPVTLDYPERKINQEHELELNENI